MVLNTAIDLIWSSHFQGNRGQEGNGSRRLGIQLQIWILSESLLLVEPLTCTRLYRDQRRDFYFTMHPWSEWEQQRKIDWRGNKRKRKERGKENKFGRTTFSRQRALQVDGGSRNILDGGEKVFPMYFVELTTFAWAVKPFFFPLLQVRS